MKEGPDLFQVVIAIVEGERCQVRAGRQFLKRQHPVTQRKAPKQDEAAKVTGKRGRKGVAGIEIDPEFG